MARGDCGRRSGGGAEAACKNLGIRSEETEEEVRARGEHEVTQRRNEDGARTCGRSGGGGGWEAACKNLGMRNEEAEEEVRERGASKKSQRGGAAAWRRARDDEMAAR
jgi:hypothetical protein